MPISLILTVLLILFVLTMLAKTVRVIPQGRAGIVERLGKFHAVLNPGLHIVIPVIDRVLPLIDLREQVVSFPSPSVITEDNLVVGIDTVVYFQVTAAILTAEGQKQSDILTAEGESRAAILRAEGEKQAQILRAEGDAQSAILRANGEAEAVQKVFAAIHESNPSQQLLTYQYLQTLPKLAEGDANKLWFIPTELGDALRGLGNAFGTLPASDLAGAPKKPAAAAPKSAPQASGSYGINS